MRSMRNYWNATQNNYYIHVQYNICIKTHTTFYPERTKNYLHPCTPPKIRKISPNERQKYTLLCTYYHTHTHAHTRLIRLIFTQHSLTHTGTHAHTHTQNKKLVVSARLQLFRPKPTHTPPVYLRKNTYIIINKRSHEK